MRIRQDNMRLAKAIRDLQIATDNEMVFILTQPYEKAERKAAELRSRWELNRAMTDEHFRKIVELVRREI